MKVIINRQTAQIELSPTPDYISPNMILFGRIDKLNTEGNAIWNPDFTQIESCLDQQEPDQIINKIPNIEGQYLIIWHKEEKINIFSDRYCVNTHYYRVSSETLEIFDHILGESCSKS